AYVRVSTDEQAEKGTGIVTQKKTIEGFCERAKLRIYDFYEDERSGASLERPGLRRLLEDAEKGKFKVVLVYKTDRLSRSIKDIVRLVLDDFERLGLTFKSATEPYDTSTAAGRMFFVQLGGFADFERELIRERTRSGKLNTALKGKWVGSILPFGYKKDSEGYLVPDHEEVEIYKKIVSWCLEGNSTLKIARKLNELGIPTERSKHSSRAKNFKWKPGTVYRILTNPLYKGCFKYRGHEIKVPALISEQDFELVKKQLDSNYNNAGRNNKVHFYLLRGLLYCKKCERKLFGYIKPSRGMRVYCCLSKRADPDPRFCGLKNVNIDKLNNAVWENVKEMLKNSQKLREAIKRHRNSAIVDRAILEAKLKKINRDIEANKQETDATLDLYIKAKKLTVEQLDERIGKIKEERDELLKRRESILERIAKAKEAKTTLEKVERFASEISKNLDSYTEQEKYDLLHTIVSKIIVDYDADTDMHSIEIEGMIPVFEEKAQKEESPIASMQRILP
ncbi:MAG TPA: hypothetical protein DHV62_01215, partial [Elusimicrobia bacterium]|nr:hypothetical protein [Elusimicrobiota bacterium]